ncbi:hypothetical protein HK097_000277 [Rhizophlyctis rosea]|uniref:Heterokaryon incompatibility domain-containing protein n=1 Tax=Rhizophlyctis rosea TaxID=64517 RepID=A0AAD5S5M7_9FUNG|nr:hypothetical protein HK097_000277 [Rhizophlyctis rosea]
MPYIKSDGTEVPILADAPFADLKREGDRPRRIYDIYTSKIRELLPDEPFIALSYMWPNNPATTREWIFKDDLRQLEWRVKGISLDKFSVIVRELRRHKYGTALWADFLCVNQDEPDEVKEEIASSRQYYRSATVVLVAPWTSHGYTPEACRASCGRWMTRVWPVQELVAAKYAVVLLPSVDGPARPWWISPIDRNLNVHKSATMHLTPELVDRWCALRKVVTYGENMDMTIEGAIRCVFGNSPRLNADAIYGSVGLAGWKQRLGELSADYQRGVQWLYGELEAKRRARLLWITGTGYTAPGCSWMPDHGNRGVASLVPTIVDDCEPDDLKFVLIRGRGLRMTTKVANVLLLSDCYSRIASDLVEQIAIEDVAVVRETEEQYKIALWKESTGQNGISVWKEGAVWEDTFQDCPVGRRSALGMIDGKIFKLDITGTVEYGSFCMARLGGNEKYGVWLLLTQPGPGVYHKVGVVIMQQTVDAQVEAAQETILVG